MTEAEILIISDFVPSEEKCSNIFGKLDDVVCPICDSTKVKKNGAESSFGLRRFKQVLMLKK